MDENDKKNRIATFRFGVISDFVTGARLKYGEKTRLLSEKIAREYEIPGSGRSSLSRATIMSWIRKYKLGGSRFEALLPKRRCDFGKFRKLDATLRLAIKDMKCVEPKLTVPAIEKKLRHSHLLGLDDRLNYSSVYRFLQAEREAIEAAISVAQDRRTFEASYSNEIWQCDTMHGPKIKVGKEMRKTYLLAIIDDHSRMIIYGAFYLNETLDSLKHCLREGIERRGLPQKFYVDNGAAYSAQGLSQTAALLGIQIIHSRPYTPQGRGKIERWFRTVREGFLPFVAKDITHMELNQAFDLWVDQYNESEHGTTKMNPVDRYRRGLQCARPAPVNLMDYFRHIEFRRVRKDRTIQIGGRLFEVPLGLMDKKVECRFHLEKPNDVEIFHNSLSYGRAKLVDRQVNARIGRDWSVPKAKDRPLMNVEREPIDGKLFSGTEVGDENEVQ